MINVFGSDISLAEIQAVTACLQSQWIGFGKSVETFEEEFSASRNVPNFLMVDSGSNALFMACKLLELPPGAEVIVPSFTWVSCAQSILLAGLKPVFADVDLNTMNVTAESISKVISPFTGAIMVVHYAGLPCLMDDIVNLGYPVIEDAAHAVCSSFDGRSCGSIGDIGIYSFDAVKNLTAIEGGGITFQDRHLYSKAKKLRYCGIGKSGFDSASESSTCNWWEYNIGEPFIKMLPTNIHAVVASTQLRRLEELQKKRLQIWQLYDTCLSQLPEISLPVLSQRHSVHGLFTYCIRTTRRDELAQYLLKNSVYTTLRYHPLHLSPLYGQEHLSLPNTEQLNREALSLPLHPRLTLDDARIVVRLIRSFYGYDM